MRLPEVGRRSDAGRIAAEFDCIRIVKRFVSCAGNISRAGAGSALRVAIHRHCRNDWRPRAVCPNWVG
jgi:hypothetical protein